MSGEANMKPLGWSAAATIAMTAPLAIAFSGVGSIAIAADQQTTANKVSSLLTSIAHDARGPITSQVRSVSLGRDVDCEKARTGDLTGTGGKSTAAQRYEAALLFRQCL